jgi:hypothetical protein
MSRDDSYGVVTTVDVMMTIGGVKMMIQRRCVENGCWGGGVVSVVTALPVK